MELGSDNFGSFLSCITCGYTINSRSIGSNGSIAEPATIDEDVVIAPTLEPVMVAVMGRGENRSRSLILNCLKKSLKLSI